MKYLYFPTLSSTNDYLKEHYLDFEYPTYCVTYNQTKGRGRTGHSWEASPNLNLALSVLFKVDDIKENITLKAAIAVTKALKNIIDLAYNIKWPNDILIGNKKICGILTEGITTKDAIYLIIGIGVNINQINFSKDIDDKTTSLKKETGKEYLIKDIEDEIINKLNFIINHYNDQLDVDFIKKHLYGMNKEISYHQGQEIKKGRIIDLKTNGELVIETENDIKNIRTGEITIIR